MQLKALLASVLLAVSVCINCALADQNTGSIYKELDLNPAVKEIVKITDTGLAPSRTTLYKLDGSVFFLNLTRDSLVTLQIDFNGRRIHCASENLVADRAGQLVSKAPVAPRDFALTCFPEKGVYKFKVFGVGDAASPLIGEVVVK